MKQLLMALVVIGGDGGSRKTRLRAIIDCWSFHRDRKESEQRRKMSGLERAVACARQLKP